MKIAVLLCAVLVQAFAMSTPPTHPTHPTHPHHPTHPDHHGPGQHEHLPGGDHGHNIHETHVFSYMEHTNTMVAVVNHNCYTLKLVDSQKEDVKDSMKLHDIEAQMIKAIDGKHYTVMHQDHHAPHMDHGMEHLCHGHVFTIDMSI